METETPAAPIPGERIQRVLSRAGIASRRQLESWIEAGRIQVNRAPAHLGQHVLPTDEIRLDGRRVHGVFEGDTESVPLRVIAYHKPVGEITTRKVPEGRKSAFDQLPKLRRGRWISIGRLDINTSGLLVFTTDGELAHRLMHPSHDVDREYAVRVLGRATDEQLQQLRDGVELEDGPAQFSDISRSGEGEGHNQWYHVTLLEGRNREVRRLWEAVGLQVTRLMRVRYGPVFLDRLGPSKWREVEGEELKTLFEWVDYTPQQPISRKTRERDPRTGKPIRVPGEVTHKTPRTRSNGLLRRNRRPSPR